jgi:hypothetical protein
MSFVAKINQMSGYTKYKEPKENLRKPINSPKTRLAIKSASSRNERHLVPRINAGG